MTDQPLGNSFRRAVLNGERHKLILNEKTPRLDHSSDSIDGSIVPRAEIRRNDHRDQDRHRLSGETATARHEGRSYTVEVINLSGGGAMLRAGFKPMLWDILELDFGHGSTVEGAVRWIREDRLGVEFAHETRIECDPRERAQLLLEVIQRSFPESDVHVDVPMPVDGAQTAESEEEEDLGNRDEVRHPLVWKGQILYSFDSNPVRLRNVSTGGALLDVAIEYPLGAEVMLDLSEAGQYSAIVAWAHGDQVGLRFKEPFDLQMLAKLRPDMAAYRWQKPDFLEEHEVDPDAEDRWDRCSVDELKSRLEGFLKY